MSCSMMRFSLHKDQGCYELEHGCASIYGFEYKPGELDCTVNSWMTVETDLSLIGFDNAVRSHVLKTAKS